MERTRSACRGATSPSAERLDAAISRALLVLSQSPQLGSRDARFHGCDSGIGCHAGPVPGPDVVENLYQSRSTRSFGLSELSFGVDGRYGCAMVVSDARGLVWFVICPSEIGVAN